MQCSGANYLPDLYNACSVQGLVNYLPDLHAMLAHLVCSMRATMPAAMGAAADVPEKDVVQPP